MSLRIAAIIAEYNPFHNGHMHHIARTREAGYDRIVCIMDGHLTQRGNFTALGKWSRARAALMCGADAVIELPALLACRSADVFASAGVAIAAAIGADALSFGSETGDISLLQAMADAEEDDVFRETLNSSLSRGESLPRARAAAMARLLGREDVPAGPNAILATEYLRALRALGKNAPEPLVICRRESYHSLATGPMASASAIRTAVSGGAMAAAAEGVPAQVHFQLNEMAARHDADDMYLHALRRLGPEGLRALPDVTEGLENRMHAAAREAATLEDALAAAKCKRYTYARLMRLATHALTGLTMELAARHPGPEYIRLLGMRADTDDTVSEIARRARLPMFSFPKMRENEMFAFEERVTELWALTRDLPDERRSGQEYTRKFVRI